MILHYSTRAIRSGGVGKAPVRACVSVWVWLRVRVRGCVGTLVCKYSEKRPSVSF